MPDRFSLAAGWFPSGSLFQRIMKWQKIKPYAYLAPALFFSGLIVFFPILQVIIYSLSKWSFLEYTPALSLQNYRDIFKDKIFWQIILNNIKVLLNVPIQIALAVLFASLLYEQFAGHHVYQVCYFIPTILPIIVVGVIWTFIFRLSGPLNTLLRFIGLGRFTRLWLGEVRWSLPSAVMVMIWKDVGFVIVLFLARLLSAPPEIFDAAKIDGANSWRIFIHIKIPEMYSIINTYTVLGIIWSFTDVFNYVYVMTAGGPGYSSTVVEYRIYFQAFKNFKMGYASALSVFVLLIILLLVFIYFKLQKREQE